MYFDYFLNANFLNKTYVKIAAVNVATICPKYTFSASFFTNNSNKNAFIK